MCFSSPHIVRPDEPQETKKPDSVSEVRRKKPTGAPMAGGTWLTGSQGVPQSTMNTGSTTLLGG